LAYDCPWLADPIREPTDGEIFILIFDTSNMITLI
jgi:hypothetical protein